MAGPGIVLIKLLCFCLATLDQSVNLQNKKTAELKNKICCGIQVTMTVADLKNEFSGLQILQQEKGC